MTVKNKYIMYHGMHFDMGEWFYLGEIRKVTILYKVNQDVKAKMIGSSIIEQPSDISSWNPFSNEDDLFERLLDEQWYFTHHIDYI